MISAEGEIKLNGQIAETYSLCAQAKAVQENYYAADKDWESALMREPENPCLYSVRGHNDYLKMRKKDCRQQLAHKAEQERCYELRRKINA